MVLDDRDKLTIIRIQSLLVKLRSFTNKYQMWFYLGYIENFVDELEIRSKIQNKTEVVT